ncbi:hypothetical protein JG687_00014691 [Phytophthora cactorum]|uniref:Uncharacterized protein n=1 Tax=Phytophthora cactorum TaxID=29920 RepID=A0A329SBC7_9STRA|nr:hypothetical protein Pcac1_g7249 [Phytophthora cactorum]KAG2805651.1 hypothetical protein PC111_g17713 [Phytophthora cactorum]KAG2821947.1 hypothetical protein PC112_g11156 [Phytophthora cactorum]KAG2856815.1 hypothetical protein PC113_g11244 [Phytophthora cactorum]KAG2907778.1 hypothetical protein PC114_g10717 [Phytophthora cactorum]
MPANSAITSTSKANANSSAGPSISGPDISAAATSDSNVKIHGVSASSSTAWATKTPVLTIADLLFDDITSVDDAKSMLMTFGAKQLRTECYLRELGIGKKRSNCNNHKMGCAYLLLDPKRDAETRCGVGACKEAGINGIEEEDTDFMPRLLNVMTSHRIIHRLRDIDGLPLRQELDTIQTHANPSIWVDVHKEFNTPRMEYGALVSELDTFAKCNPRIIVPHDSASLRDMWKDITSL